MPITRIDRTVLSRLEPAVLAKLNETLGKEFGLSFDFKGGTYDREGKYATLKLEIAVKTSSGEVASKERETFKKSADLVGLKPEWLDTTYRSGNREMRIVGLDLKKRKNCVLVEDVKSGTTYVTTPDAVRRGKGAAVSATVIPGAVNHAEIERRIADMKQNNPEMYYADGIFQTEMKMNEKQIHDHHYALIERQMRSGSTLPPMFGK